MTNTLLTVLTNGRDDIFHTLPHAVDQLKGDFNARIIVDDSGMEHFRTKLHSSFPDFVVIPTGHHDGGGLGFNIAMRTVMRAVAEFSPDVVFHLEDDFVLEREVDVAAMSSLLLDRNLLQVALLRQPWFGNEVNAGGVLEAREAQGATFHSMHDGVHDWTEHRDHMTLNPCVMPGWVGRRGWPQGTWSESRWGRELFEDYPTLSAAYWGDRSEGPWVTHVGERSGFDY
jgi:hypothetical protein